MVEIDIDGGNEDLWWMGSGVAVTEVEVESELPWRSGQVAKNGAESRDDGLVGNAGGFEKGVHLKQENVNMRVDVQAVGDIPARGSTRAGSSP